MKPVAPTPLLRIGPFSRATSLSVKALRSYHEAGLLVPAVVDPDTGYRQLMTAGIATIKATMEKPRSDQ